MGDAIHMTASDRFEAFVRRYQDMVFATAVRLLGNPADAEDVAQGVFLKAFQHSATVVDGDRAAGWLKTVTRHACLNHLSRYRARWRFFSEISGADAEGAPTDFEATLVSDVSPAAQLERADQQARLEGALLRLPDHQRVPLVLYHLEDMRYQDIADALGISLGKVKTDIHRGRDALRKLLTNDAPG